jgi:hypothetical protein
LETDPHKHVHNLGGRYWNFESEIASQNAARLNLEPGSNRVVRYTVVDPTGQELAPDEDPLEITEFNEWLAEYEDEDEDE